MERHQITGHTELIGLLAYPIRHSQSPATHNAAYEKLGVDIVNLAFEVDAPELEDAIKGLRALKMRGANVSMPNKTIVHQYLDEISPAARLCGAVNTIVCCVGRHIRDDIAMDLLRRSVSAVTLDKKSIISSLTRVVESVLASGEDSGEQELRRLELELEKLQARNDTIHDRFFDESITKADYQRAKARCESEMNRVQEKITAIKQRQALNTDTQTLKPDIRAAITGIVSGRTADDDFYGHLLQQMTVYRDGRVEVALNLLPAKWVYVLDGLEKYRAKIGGHDASSVPMSVSRPLSSG